MAFPETMTEQNHGRPGAPRNVRWSLFWMVVIGLGIRLAVVGFLYPERLNPDRNHWRFAGETGHIAQSIVEGNGFSSPFHGPTGPTAIMPPIYPAIVAGVFSIFGIYTKASALIMMFLDSLFSALSRMIHRRREWSNEG